MLSVWCGANRFEHSEVTRHDSVLQKLFDFKCMANFKAIMRFYRKFDHITLDLDSTVMTRYGQQQEGAARGYNPRKPGRNAHHPLMAFVADARMTTNFWLRPGSSHSANNALAFLDDSLDKLGGKQVALLRADSGFSDQAFISDLERREMYYLIALKLNQLKWSPVTVQPESRIKLCHC